MIQFVPLKSLSFCARYNQIKNLNKIESGQVLRLPSTVFDYTLMREFVLSSLSQGKELIKDTYKEFVSIPEKIKKKKEELEEKLPAFLRLGLNLSLMDRSLTDTTTRATGTGRSDAILGLNLGTTLPLSDTSDFEFSVNYTKMKFNASTNKSLNQESETFFGLNASYNKSFENFILKSGISYFQEPYYTGFSSIL